MTDKDIPPAIRQDAATRAFAGAIALVAWIGLGLQYAGIRSHHDGAAEALWVFFRFFTNTTNLLIAIGFTAIAIGQWRPASARLLAGLTLAILLVGIVYGLLLQGRVTSVGYAIPANMLLHKVTPLLVPAFWLCCARKGTLEPADPLWWAAYPFFYLFYALARGLAGDRYAYFFIDPTKQGWAGVATYVALIALGFVLAGYALFWADRGLARSRSRTR